MGFGAWTQAAAPRAGLAASLDVDDWPAETRTPIDMLLFTSARELVTNVVRHAQAQGISVRTFVIPLHEVDRAIVDGEEDGFVKIHVRERSDKILGATIVARHAGDMINETMPSTVTPATKS